MTTPPPSGIAALVAAYVSERAGRAPTRGQLHHELRDLARELDR